MHLKIPCLKKWSMALMLSGALTLCAQDQPAGAPAAVPAVPASAGAKPAVDFNAVADQALAAMAKRADELNVKGVAVVAYSEGDTVQSWSSKMVAVGRLTSPPSSNSPAGENNLAIAYTKAAEMASTLRDSGSHSRPLLRGENGWQGGVVAKGKTGLLIAAFSGGVSADDVKVSRAGLAVLTEGL
jgi:hypothetical protein